MGTLYVVSTPIGNLADVTYRAVEVLGSSGVIFAEDTRRTRVLLDHYGIEPAGIRSYHRHNEAVRTQEARELLSSGTSIALVTDSGTPLISDPGHRLVTMAIEIGARVVPIPGASAALAALVGSGLEPSAFVFLGFLPRSGGERLRRLETLEALPWTALLYESPQRLLSTLEDLAEHVGAERAVVVARELTKIHEEFFRGTLSEAVAYYSENEPRGEIVICLAPAAVPESKNLEAARQLASDLAREGSSSRDIVRELRERYGIERNRAYDMALEAAEEGKP